MFSFIFSSTSLISLQSGQMNEVNFGAQVSQAAFPLWQNNPFLWLASCNFQSSDLIHTVTKFAGDWRRRQSEVETQRMRRIRADYRFEQQRSKSEQQTSAEARGSRLG